MKWVTIKSCGNIISSKEQKCSEDVSTDVNLINDDGSEDTIIKNKAGNYVLNSNYSVSKLSETFYKKLTENFTV